MPPSPSDSELKTRYIKSVDCIMRHLYAATQRIIEHYQAHQLTITPQGIIRLYCYCFGFTLAHGVIERHADILQQFLAKMHLQIKAGQQLHHTMMHFKKTGTWPPNDLVKENGLLMVKHAAQLIQFVTDKTYISLQQEERDYSTDEQRDLNFQFTEFVRMAFGEMIEMTTAELEELQVATPSGFFLDHFANFLGWMIGFFVELMDIPVEDITRRVTDWIRVTVEIEVVKPATIH